MFDTTAISQAAARLEVQVRFADGRVFNGPIGMPAGAFVKAAAMPGQGRIVAALINGQLRELAEPIMADSSLTPVSLADPDGARIYRRSLSFLMIAAAAEVLADDVITIQHSMPFGGYYCERNQGHPLTDDELELLKARMRQLVEEDIPITRVRVPLDEALQLFRDNGDLEKADLFSNRRKDYLTLYDLNGVRDYFHGFMVPSTGYLDLFDLCHYADGFILMFPRRHDPGRLQAFEDEPRLARVFREYDDWLTTVGVPSVAALNRGIREGRIQEIILVAEALHNRQFASIANDIAGRRPGLKLVFISGPSSAGKTTFSKRLAVQLLALGIHPIAMTMDDYFVDRGRTPRDEHGEYDFEALEAVDLPLLKHHLKLLLAGNQIQLPRYNFITGSREPGPELRMAADEVILIEGIHGLNPRLVEGIPQRAFYRVFVSALTQLNLDKHNRVPTTDTRMLRRIVRDAARRGYNATETIRRWPSVRRGETRYIFPCQNNADVFFNSALVYELSVLKPMAFEPIPDANVPSDSILREFVGGSIMERFEPWLG
jgi:uridine kinase